MGRGILLSQGAEVDFMIHGVFSYHLFGQEFWITTTHICLLIVMLVRSVRAASADGGLWRDFSAGHYDFYAHSFQ